MSRIELARQAGGARDSYQRSVTGAGDRLTVYQLPLYDYTRSRESRRRQLQPAFTAGLRKVRTPERPNLLGNAQCERS